MNNLQKEMVKYAIEKSDQALEKAIILLQKDYLTDTPAKLYDAVICILLALAYSTNYINKPDNNCQTYDIFFVWKSDKDKFMTNQNNNLAKWFKRYSKEKLSNNSLYGIYKHLYQKDLTFNTDIVTSINKNDLIEDMEKAKNFIQSIKVHIYTIT